VIDEPSIRIYVTVPRPVRWEYTLHGRCGQDTTYSLPLAPLGPNPPPVYIVVVDRSNGNVTNSSVADASGTIRLHSYSCAGAIHMYVTVDAIVGDTNAADQMRVQGSFQGTYPAKTCN
jgi:hypothetical protein